ncbi:glutathione-dependent formaldehyde-activating enzyme [Xylaria arbuscula]|nr:glutathione-dependent formaldehyde-activating enzyme [Xylaria arbuscula]
MAAEQQEQLKTYRGNCHCAAFVYEITLPEIKQATECNCSICYKKAAIWVFPKPSDVKFVKGDPSGLTDYTFNTKQFTHKFCPTCGVSLMVIGHLKPPAAGEDKQPDNGFNVRTFQHGQVDVWNLDIKTFNGKSIPSTYETPKYTGPEPQGFDDLQLYTGSCHCGGVKFALKSEPLNKDTQGLLECNCSSCARYGATWAYPFGKQIAWEGEENIGSYLFNKNIVNKRFCKICGVPIGSVGVELTDEELAKFDANTQGWHKSFKGKVALNLRLVDGLDVKDLKTTRMDGYGLIKPGYVEP